jgi:alpha-tubulin suppressor-like RCC1 family protein
VQLSIGKRFLLMRTAKGDVWTVGCNEQNCLNQPATHFIVPTLVFQEIRSIASGWAHTIVLTANGRIRTYGRNNLSQLGREPDKEFELCLKEDEEVQSIVSGTEFGFVVSSKGRVFGWGWNEHCNISECSSWSLPAPKAIYLPRPCHRLWTHPATTIF